MNWVVCGVIELESVNYAFNYFNPVTGSLLSKENAVAAYLNEVFVRRGDGVDNESPSNAISISYNIRCCARSEAEKKREDGGRCDAHVDKMYYGCLHCQIFYL